MIDEKQITELRKAYQVLWTSPRFPYVGNLFEALDTIEALWKENAELKKQRDFLQELINGSELQMRNEKLEAVAEALEAAAVKIETHPHIGGAIRSTDGCLCDEFAVQQIRSLKPLPTISERR